MTPIADLRLAILAGKGGVGRTTVAAALARALAAQGQRVLIAQTEAAERLGKLFGRAEPIGTDIVTLAPGIDAVNMTPKSALHEYGLMVLRYETVYRALFENRAVRGFLGAIPGLDAYAMLGKVWWHTTETGARAAALRPGDPRRAGERARDADAAPAAGGAVRHAARTADARRPGRPRPAHRPGADGDGHRDPARGAAGPRDGRAGAQRARDAEDPARPGGRERHAPRRPVDAEPWTRSWPACGSRPAIPSWTRPWPWRRGVRAHRRTADDMLARLKANPGLPMVLLPRVPTADLGPEDVEQLAGLLR